MSKDFKEMVQILDRLDKFDFTNDELQKKKRILRVNFINALCMSLRDLRSRTNNMIDSRDYLPPEK